MPDDKNHKMTHELINGTLFVSSDDILTVFISDIYASLTSALSQ